MNEEQKKYINAISEISIIFSIGISKQIDYIYDVALLEDIKNILYILTQEGSIVDVVKRRIYDFLFSCRDIYDDDREKRIEIVNEIIIILNNQETDENLKFYRKELARRRCNMKYLLTSSINEIRSEIENVNKSLMYDSVVLHSFNEEISDEEFRNKYMPILINNKYYLESISSFLHECPLLFINPTFYNRCKTALDNLDNDIVNSQKKILKKVKKVIK